MSAPPGGAFVFGPHTYAANARVHLAAGEPERGEALLRPMLEAAETSGWRDAAATTVLVLGLCVEARGELEEAVVQLAHAAEIADEHGMPALGWEAHGPLARMYRNGGRLAEADDQAAMAQAIVERVIARLKDEELREGVGKRAKAWLGSGRKPPHHLAAERLAIAQRPAPKAPRDPGVA